MDNLAVILGVDENKIKEELGDVKISKMVFPQVRELFDNDYDKFKKFYKYCKGNIPSLLYQFTECYKSFELNIVNNDIPFMSEEDEKDMMRLINSYHNNLNDNLNGIKKMLIELNKKNVQIDTSDIVKAYDRETLLLQDIFKDINSKLESIKNENVPVLTDQETIQESSVKLFVKRIGKQWEHIKKHPSKLIIFILIVICAFVLGGIFI